MSTVNLTISHRRYAMQGGFIWKLLNKQKYLADVWFRKGIIRTSQSLILTEKESKRVLTLCEKDLRENIPTYRNCIIITDKQNPTILTKKMMQDLSVYRTAMVAVDTMAPILYIKKDKDDNIVVSSNTAKNIIRKWRATFVKIIAIEKDNYREHEPCKACGKVFRTFNNTIRYDHDNAVKGQKGTIWVESPEYKSPFCPNCVCELRKAMKDE